MYSVLTNLLESKKKERGKKIKKKFWLLLVKQAPNRLTMSFYKLLSKTQKVN